jgi:hypothetical protein
MLVFAIFAQASAMLIAAIFVMAGFSKLRPENQTFYHQAIDNYALTPQSWSTLLIGGLGVFEIGTASLILFPVSQFIGLLLAATLLLIYAVAFIKVIREGKANIDCGCSGPSGKLTIGYALVVRNLTLIALAVIGLWLGEPLLPNTWLILLLTLAVLGLVYASAEQLISNAQVIDKLQDSRL